MTDDHVLIRPAVIADADELAKLGGRTFRATYAGDMPADALDEYIHDHFGPLQQRRELTDPARRMLVADEDSTMVGYALLRAATGPTSAAATGTVQLERLYVDQQAQARGVGTALLEQAIQAAGRDGHHRMWLTVWEHNTRALAVYRRWGFTDVGHVGFDIAGEHQRDRVLLRALT